MYQVQAEVLLLDVRSLLRLTDQLFLFHQFPCDLEFIPVDPWYVLPVSPDLMTIPDSFIVYLEMINYLNGHCAIRENINVPASLPLFYILHYACPDGICFCLEYHAVEPKTEAVPHFEPHLYTAAPVPSLVLDHYVYQTRLPYYLG